MISAITSFICTKSIKTSEKSKAISEAFKTKKQVEKVELRLLRLIKFVRLNSDFVASTLGIDGLDTCLRFSQDREMCLLIYSEVN